MGRRQPPIQDCYSKATRVGAAWEGPARATPVWRRVNRAGSSKGYHLRMLVAVPPWNARGVIDPVNVLSPTASDRSPYRVSLRAFVSHFATSGRRIEVLRGLLAYRQELQAVGLQAGFQWLDGSFLEDIERTERRDPGDIDVVTFYVMPTGQNQGSLRAQNPGLFPTSAVEFKALKDRLHVDAYLQQLDSNGPVAAVNERLVNRAAYWYSMWSHRRDFSWKGFLQVDLAATEDSIASADLDAVQGLRTAAPLTIATAPAAASNAAKGQP